MKFKKSSRFILFIIILNQLVAGDLKAKNVGDTLLFAAQTTGILCACGLIYELTVSGTYTPLLHDITLVEELIYLSDRQELSLPLYDTIAGQIKKVPPYQLQYVRSLLESNSDQDPADYMTHVVIKQLYLRHSRIGLVARWKMRADKRADQCRRIVAASQAILQKWYHKTYRMLWGEPGETDDLKGLSRKKKQSTSRSIASSG